MSETCVASQQEAEVLRHGHKVALEPHTLGGFEAAGWIICFMSHQIRLFAVEKHLDNGNK